VLYPVTQVRVTLLLRDTAMPQDISAVAEDVSAEVWQRRAELAERAPAALSELRARFTELQRIGGLRGQADLVASALGFAAFWLFGAALWNTLQRVSRHQDLLSALGRAVGPWIAFVVLLIVRDSLPAGSRWWVWTCATGLGMGLFGLWYVPRLKRSRARSAASRTDSAPG